mmetsp:Transcript_16605/g.30206  ORF Transcript_16605/g.30206 Transcript_16605/m.30206 type:complete len:335 (-) Transcript_16605:66-1070(-)
MKFLSILLLLLSTRIGVINAFGRVVGGSSTKLNNAASNSPSSHPSKVIVTGAAGRTGKLVFAILNADEQFQAVGLVRTESSGKKLMHEVKCGLDQVVVSDVTQLDIESEDGIPQGLNGAEAMVICTSAVPNISKSSVLKALLKVPMNVIMGEKPFNFRSLRFRYRPGLYPEKVDYEGQKKQIDLAKKLGIKQVVVVSSMGGTDPSNFLNSIGKGKDGSGNGDILLWKRKAEKYLVETGLRYSIIHPGGLLDTPAGTQQLILDVDDKLLKNEKRSISRGDVANLCVAALTVGHGRDVSFDCISREVEDGIGPVPPTAEKVFTDFLAEGKTTNYSL